MKTDGDSYPAWLWSLPVNHLFFPFLFSGVARSGRGMSQQLHLGVGGRGFPECYLVVCPQLAFFSIIILEHFSYRALWSAINNTSPQVNGFLLAIKQSILLDWKSQSGSLNALWAQPLLIPHRSSKAGTALPQFAFPPHTSYPLQMQ